MKNDEHVIIGIYPHESKDLVSVVVLSNDGNIHARSVIQYEGIEAINFLDDLKNKPLWKHVDTCVISENHKAKEISSQLEIENKSVILVYLTPRKFFDVYGSKKFSDFSLLLNYITEKHEKHLIQFPHVSNELMNELIKQFENFGLGMNYNLESILNNKDVAGDSIWAFILACQGMMSLEYNQTIKEVIQP